MTLVALIVLIGVVAASAAPTAEENLQLSNTYGPSLIDGNCTIIPDQELIYTDHIHKTRIPLFTRSATSTYYGDKTIYCIRVINQKSEDRGGIANITEGGVDHSFATIEMHSYVSHGIEFLINIYGK